MMPQNLRPPLLRGGRGKFPVERADLPKLVCWKAWRRFYLSLSTL